MITSTSVIDVVNATAPRSQMPSGQIDKNTFLTLLVTQLQHQDPVNPMQSEEFMGQLAQFNQLEQSMNLNESFQDFLGFQALTQASSLIGKEVQALDFESDETGLQKGIVEEVILLNGNPIMKLSNGGEVPIQAVVTVSSVSEE